MTDAFEGAWCLVSREYPPHSGGGIGTYAKTFARQLADHGIPVVVITAHADVRTEQSDHGITVVRLPLNADDRWLGPHPSIATPDMTTLWSTLGPHSVFSKQIADLAPELLDRFNVRLIEGCDTGAPLWHLLDDRAQSKWSADMRIITHVHSPSLWIERLNRRLEQSRTMHELQRMEREQTRWSDAAVTPSVGMQAWLAQHWGVRADVIRYPFVLPPQLPTGSGGVLFVGRLEYRKGIDTLLRAWPRVSTTAALTVVGSDVIDYRTGAPIGASMRAGLDRVTFLGPQPPELVAQLQHQASVVVVPSPDDNSPFTCTEAMAAGRVVVAANAGGAAEMIDHGTSGLLFDPYDDKGLASALNAALHMSGDDCARMGNAARERIASLCDPARVLTERVAHAARPAANTPMHPDSDPEPPVALRRLGSHSPHDTRSIWRRIVSRLRS